MNDLINGNKALIAGIEVRLIEENGVRMINANDLHKASGGEKKNSPNEFLRNAKTKSLIDQLVMSRPENPGLLQDKDSVALVVNGNTSNQGTWLCEEMTYSYIAWVSPEFNARVFTAVKHLINGETEKATEALTGHKANDNNIDLPETIEKGIETATAAMRFLQAGGLNNNQAMLSADKFCRRITGISVLEQTDNLHLIAESKEKIFTPTEIGQTLKPPLSAVKTNKLLEEKGLQYKIGKQWVATDKGLTYAEMLDTNKKNSDGTPVKQMKWKESVFDVL